MEDKEFVKSIAQETGDPLLNIALICSNALSEQGVTAEEYVNTVFESDAKVAIFATGIELLLRSEEL